jgi:iron complex outermembrane receptor protein
MRRLNQIVWSSLAPALAFAIGVAVMVVPDAAFADEVEGAQLPEVSQAPERAQPRAGLEEIIVTARRQEETLQDVPVTISAFTEEDLDRYGITSLEEVAQMVPNMQIFAVGSGNNSNLYLRGVGTSSISAAFDQSVALNFDGVVANVGRLILSSYLDIAQIEVLKGPQSLYFGKSATSGVISITSRDPGDEFEVEGKVGYEVEHDQTYGELIVSGPITEDFGARLAWGFTKADELYENILHDVFPGRVAKPWRGEESQNLRLTLDWDVSDVLSAKLKFTWSGYENDGPIANAELLCPNGSPQPTNTNFSILPNFDDCKLNRNFNSADAHPAFRGQYAGSNNGVPYVDQDTYLTSLTIDFALSETLALTSVTAYLDTDYHDFELYDYGSNGVYAGAVINYHEIFSQEFRLASQFDGPVNFTAGLFYQDIEEGFETGQNAFNIPLLVGPDPVTGNTFDWTKNHYTDAETWSAFAAVYWDVTDAVEVTAGVRYTDEEKDGEIEIEYMHAFLPLLGMLPTGTVIGGLDFEDDNWSPEVAVTWHATDDISFFVAYKEGFKSGGIDNSALPSASLNPANPAFPGFLIYDSEESQGGEIGMKAHLLDQSLRLNATVFSYEYSDLQVQQFDSTLIQFFTSNASELTTEGVELDARWVTPVEGLMLRGALAYTNTEYTDTFINVDGVDLDGEDLDRSSEWTGFIGATYEMNLGASLGLSLSLDAHYNDGYPLAFDPFPLEHDDFWRTDAAIRLYDQDRKWDIALIIRNWADETYSYAGGGNPPGRVVNPATGLGDRSFATALGRTIALEARMRF